MQNLEEKYKINFKYNIKEYWKVLKHYKASFAFLLFLALLIEAANVFPKFLFKEIVDKGETFVSGALPKTEFVGILTTIGLIFVGVVILRATIKWFIIHFVNTIDSAMMLDLKKKYFDHIVTLSHKFHTTHKSGSLISRMIRGSGAIEGMNDILVFQFLPLFFNLVLVGISLAYFSIIPSIVITLTAIVFVGYSYLIQRKQQTYKLTYNYEQDREKGMISDIFTNIDSIKYFGKENFIKNKFLKKITETRRVGLRYWSFYRWFDAGHLFIIGIGTLLLIYFPLMQFLSGEISLSTIVFIYTIYGNVVGPMFGFVWGMRRYYMCMADFQDLFEYGKIKNDIEDKTGAKKLKIQKGSIEFKNVYFNYGKRKFFEDFNLRIRPNEKIALVGHSGCGKSTLVNLLKRFYDVASGEILIDGKNIKEFQQESLRSETSIVPQECILFDDTIYNNIKFANPSATKREVFKAIKFAQLDKIISEFPKKANTIVGERGVKLSGGEKQRVSIARAILANKKILILDEATSALDSETEHEIQKDLQNLLKGRTSIIIAHRLSTIMNSDRIIVMKKGKIIQQGSHNRLIGQPGEYRKLWRLQKGGYIK